MIRQVISDMVPDMVKSIIRKEVTTLREEVTILREEMTMLREEVPILREEVIGLRREVRSELQSFHERISTLIKCSSTYPIPAPGPPPPPSPPPPPGPSSPLGSHSPLSPQVEKKADAIAIGPSKTDMVYFF